MVEFIVLLKIEYVCIFTCDVFNSRIQGKKSKLFIKVKQTVKTLYQFLDHNMKF